MDLHGWIAGRDGVNQRHTVEMGVPNESVIGPLLWNIGYDWVLRCELLPGMSVICYADDTLVTSQGLKYRGVGVLRWRSNCVSETPRRPQGGAGGN